MITNLVLFIVATRCTLENVIHHIRSQTFLTLSRVECNLQNQNPFTYAKTVGFGLFCASLPRCYSQSTSAAVRDVLIILQSLGLWGGPRVLWVSPWYIHYAKNLLGVSTPSFQPWVWVARSCKCSSELCMGGLLECGTVRYGLRKAPFVMHKHPPSYGAYF